MKPGTATITQTRGVNLPAGVKLKRRAKYGNRKTVVDGITFASKKEAKRYTDLRLLESVGRISNLGLQTRFRIEVNGEFVCHYVSDFEYFDCDSGAWVVEDTKGVRTPVYRLKRLLMRAALGIDVREV